MDGVMERGCSELWLLSASPAPGRDALHSVLHGWGLGREPSATGCAEKSAVHPARGASARPRWKVMVMPAGTCTHIWPSQAC